MQEHWQNLSCAPSACGGGLGYQANPQMQAADNARQLRGNVLPQRSDTVRGLLEIAHQQVVELEQEIGRLGEHLMPVRELSVAKDPGCNGSALGEPEVIGLLRGLIERLARQQSIVRAIASETRI